MFIQISLLSKQSIVNATFELCISFMNPYNMLIQATRNIELQMLHLNGLFHSLTVVTWFFNLLFSLKLPSYLNGFYPSWTVATCLFRLPFCSKLALHISHMNGFFPTWAVATCLFKSLFCSKFVLQMIRNCALKKKSTIF